MSISELIKKVKKFFKDLFKKKPKKPGKVKHFKAELIDMSNVRLTWTLPSVTGDQQVIQHTEISVRVAPTLPWTVQDTVDPSSAQELLFVDEPPGTHFYQAVVVDIDGVRGSPNETSIDVPFQPPGAVANLTAIVE